RLLKLFRRTELDGLAPCVPDRRMPRRNVIRLALLERHFAVGGLVRHLAPQDVAPVRTLAAVVGKALEEFPGIGVLRERLESARVAAVEVLVVPLVSLDLHGLRRGFLRCPWHCTTSPVRFRRP